MPHLRKNVLVKMSLQSTHLNTQNPLALRGQLSQDITLQTSEHQRLQLLVKLLNFDFMVDVVEIKLVC